MTWKRHILFLPLTLMLQKPATKITFKTADSMELKQFLTILFLVVSTNQELITQTIKNGALFNSSIKLNSSLEPILPWMTTEWFTSRTHVTLKSVESTFHSMVVRWEWTALLECQSLACTTVTCMFSSPATFSTQLPMISSSLLLKSSIRRSILVGAGT